MQHPRPLYQARQLGIYDDGHRLWFAHRPMAADRLMLAMALIITLGLLGVWQLPFGWLSLSIASLLAGILIPGAWLGNYLKRRAGPLIEIDHRTRTVRLPRSGTTIQRDQILGLQLLYRFRAGDWIHEAEGALWVPGANARMGATGIRLALVVKDTDRQIDHLPIWTSSTYDESVYGESWKDLEILARQLSDHSQLPLLDPQCRIPQDQGPTRETPSAD